MIAFARSLIGAILGALLLMLVDLRRTARRRGYKPRRFVHMPWYRETYNPTPLRWLNRLERRRRAAALASYGR